MNPIIADAGLPMIFFELPAMLLALIPVILVEVLVARRMVKVGLGLNIKAVTVANLASTLIGFPLLWLLLLGLEILFAIGRGLGLADLWPRLYTVTIEAPWLPLFDNSPDWMVPIAAMYLLIPAFFVSVYLERWICRRFWPDQTKEIVNRYSWRAHFASYAVLILVGSFFFLWASYPF